MGEIAAEYLKALRRTGGSEIRIIELLGDLKCSPPHRRLRKFGRNRR